MYILACINRENYIGKDGDLLYNIKDDIQGFKQITTDNVIIMGRSTLESLPNGKPLSNRINYVLSKTMKPEINDNLRVFSDVDKLLEDIEKNFKDKDVFCIGGSKIYELFMEKDIVDKLVLTEVDDNTKGDVKFPTIDLDKWDKVLVSEKLEDLKTGLKFTYTHYVKKEKEND